MSTILSIPGSPLRAPYGGNDLSAGHKMDSYQSKDTNECYLQNDSDVNFLQAAHILARMQQTLSHIEMLSKFQVIPAYFNAHVRKENSRTQQTAWRHSSRTGAHTHQKEHGYGVREQAQHERRQHEQNIIYFEI